VCPEAANPPTGTPIYPVYCAHSIRHTKRSTAPYEAQDSLAPARAAFKTSKARPRLPGGDCNIVLHLVSKFLVRPKFCSAPISTRSLYLSPSSPESPLLDPTMTSRQLEDFSAALKASWRGMGFLQPSPHSSGVRCPESPLPRPLKHPLKFEQESVRVRRQAGPQLSSTSNFTQTNAFSSSEHSSLVLFFGRIRVSCFLLWAPPVCFFQLDVTAQATQAVATTTYTQGCSNVAFHIRRCISYWKMINKRK